MASITISLPESLKTFVDSQLVDKGYGNVSEYLSSLLRAAQADEEEAQLEKLLLEGLASDRIPIDERFRTRLAGKADAVIERLGARSSS